MMLLLMLCVLLVLVLVLLVLVLLLLLLLLLLLWCILLGFMLMRLLLHVLLLNIITSPPMMQHHPRSPLNSRQKRRRLLLPLLLLLLLLLLLVRRLLLLLLLLVLLLHHLCPEVCGTALLPLHGYPLQVPLHLLRSLVLLHLRIIHHSCLHMRYGRNRGLHSLADCQVTCVGGLHSPVGVHSWHSIHCRWWIPLLLRVLHLSIACCHVWSLHILSSLHCSSSNRCCCFPSLARDVSQAMSLRMRGPATAGWRAHIVLPWNHVG